MICELLSRVSRDLRSIQESSLSDKASQKTTLHFELNQVKNKTKQKVLSTYTSTGKPKHSWISVLFSEV